MFWQIFKFELVYRSKRPASYIYFFVFFLLGFISIATGSSPASEKVFHNAPWTIADGTITFSLLMMLVCSAIMGVPLYRDVEHQTRQYFFSYPITKGGYFWGRFLGSFFYVLVVGTAFNWGCYLGAIMGPILGQVPAERIGDYGLWNYLEPAFLYGFSNLLIPSSIFFALVAVTRNVKVVYSASILLLIGYLLSNFLVQDLEKRDLVKLLDPFLINTFQLETRYLTPFEKNHLVLPFSKVFVINRLIWMGISIAITLFAYWRFSFSAFLNADTTKETKKKESSEQTPISQPLKRVAQDFSQGYMRRVWWRLTKIEFLNIIRDNYFKAILLGGLIFLILDFWIGNLLYSVPDRPLTIFLMDYKSYDYNLFIFIILLFYSGETIHREKTTRYNIINDAMPVSNVVFLFSKFCSMVGIAIILVTIPMVLGVIIQLLKGHTDFNFSVYFIELYVLTLPGFIQMILLSFAVHLLVNNKFGGHGVSMIIWVCLFLLRSFGEMDYNLFFYFYTPNYRWSDMNGIGHFLEPQLWFNFYWISLGCLLIVIAFLFYQRGIAGGFKERWRVASSRFNGIPRNLIVLFFLCWIGSGSYIHYNVSYLNNYTSNSKSESNSALYETTLKKYEKKLQPKVTQVLMHADIFPDERKVKIYAKVSIKNKNATAIDSLHLLADENIQYRILYNGQPLEYKSPLFFKHAAFNFLKKGKDTANYRIYGLPTPMLPDDTALLEVYSVIENKGFPNSGLSREILQNGTFYSGGIPSFGYDPNKELNSDEDRKKYKLAKKEDEYPDQNDPEGKATMLFNDDADLIHFEATVSTSKDQIAIAPGYLQKTWEKDGRKYFQYVQDTPIDYFFSILSAKYDVLKDSVSISNGNKINIEIFHDSKHKFNLDRFKAAYKDGLEYFSKSYGDFQFRQMRLMEFPRYAGFAQSFPNTVPFAESFGWVADFSDPNSFDYVYYVTAHELAHQWWGHQVVPNKTRGSNLISEALAEYTALILTERKYGKDNMKRFLKDELDGYLTGRANESKKENTFINCNRSYQWYQKGSLILYGLQDLIGVDQLNKALHEFRDSFALKENPPFAGSTDLYAFIDKYTPDSVKYYLVDTWKKITLYDNKAISAKSVSAGKDLYDVTIQINTNKYYADSTGKETLTKMNDYIDIGVFAAESTDKNGRKKVNPLFLQKYKLMPGQKTIKIRVKGKPVKAGIDPYNKLIDRIPDDNTVDIE
jgi:ABC-2 type transport system permease protein